MIDGPKMMVEVDEESGGKREHQRMGRKERKIVERKKGMLCYAMLCYMLLQTTAC